MRDKGFANCCLITWGSPNVRVGEKNHVGLSVSCWLVGWFTTHLLFGIFLTVFASLPLPNRTRLILLCIWPSFFSPFFFFWKRNQRDILKHRQIALILNLWIREELSARVSIGCRPGTIQWEIDVNVELCDKLLLDVSLSLVEAWLQGFCNLHNQGIQWCYRVFHAEQDK